jgi:hypothetical protein
MARLIVEARTAEGIGGGEWARLHLAVSVSRADDGTPVTGLKAQNFRVASHIGSVKDFRVDAREWMWEPGDREPSGCYGLRVTMEGLEEFTPHGRYVFGVQVRIISIASPLLGRLAVEDEGQTIVELIRHE